VNSMPNVGAALAEARARLRAAGIETAALDARVLAAHAFGISAEELIRDEAKPVLPSACSRLFNDVARRVQGEPVAYITGRREFWSLDFAVGPGCLIPRPDSEAIVAALLDAPGMRSKSLRILDLGTGSGCLLLALLSELPSARGIGVDADMRAVRTARTNAARAGLEGRAAFLRGDWASALTGLFDVIVANPPYIPTADIVDLPRDVRDFEPVAALDGGTDGLAALRAVMADAGRLLARGGLAALEFGPGQAAAVEQLGREIAGLCKETLIADLAGRKRGILFRRREN
jgi:release factor glutamine methyltransferase